jgi:hypothetical protein
MCLCEEVRRSKDTLIWGFRQVSNFYSINFPLNELQKKYPLSIFAFFRQNTEGVNLFYSLFD